MWVAPIRLSLVTRPTYDELAEEAASAGIAVLKVSTLPVRGAWDADSGRIYLHAALSESDRACTLAHELEHARRGDVGCQSRVVEQLVDEAVALRFVDPGEYARAEVECEGEAAAIGEELDLPVWVVRAWRGLLDRQAHLVDLTRGSA